MTGLASGPSIEWLGGALALPALLLPGLGAVVRVRQRR